MSLKSQRRLLRQNLGLEELQWEGDKWLVDNNLRRLRAKDFEMLGDLQKLTLAKWDGSDGALVEVLRTVGRTLEALEIRQLYGFKERDIATSTPLASDRAIAAGGGGGGGAGGTRLVLPRVQVLRLPCFTKISDLVYLAGCCPDLKVLNLEIAIDRFSMTHLASTLKSHCHKLTTLILRQSQDFLEVYEDDENDEDEDCEDGVRISTLIRGCSLSGLVRIEFEAAVIEPTDMDILRSVLVHSATLERLTIDYSEGKCNAFEPKDILQVLIQCRHLKTFIINGGTGRSVLATLKVLNSQPWGCFELEAIALHINADCSLSFSWRKGEYDDEYEIEDDDDCDDNGGGADEEERVRRGGRAGRGGRGGRGARKGARKSIRRSKKGSNNAPVKMSSGKSFMGWYYHSEGSLYCDNDADEVPRSALKAAFGMVKGLDRLLFLTLNAVTYARSSDPKIMEVFHCLYELL
ncbi:hypothetical protein BGZ95_000643 [Linnemannia exigua]|uniref:Uncharacterized protein n=1 Tax=Linnemannia exigua TaxID=604196 RepID=A0AAD4D8J0_9FUNG|nr:hypothetical protein BGZ95_000643 [Linnemannia exigua]